jgi:hypothetical protein
MVILSAMDSVDHGYNASVSVDKFEFSSPSEQNLNITVDVYDNTSMDIIGIEAWAKNTDFVSAEFVDWMSDIKPEDFGSESAFWAIEKPENRRYTVSLKLNVTPYSTCAYRPGVERAARLGGIQRQRIYIELRDDCRRELHNNKRLCGR